MNPLAIALAQHAHPLSRSAEQIWEQDYTFPSDFLGFAGHFPDYPLVPAVVQIMMATQSIAAALGRPVTVKRVEHAKFLAQIRPDMPVRVRVEHVRPGTWNCLLQVESPAVRAAQFTLNLQETPHAHA